MLDFLRCGAEFVPLTLQVSESHLPGLALAFPENETELPQEAQTVTTISWQAVPETSEYEVSCNPVTLREETGFQVKARRLTGATERRMTPAEPRSPSLHRRGSPAPTTAPR